MGETQAGDVLVNSEGQEDHGKINDGKILGEKPQMKEPVSLTKILRWKEGAEIKQVKRKVKMSQKGTKRKASGGKRRRKKQKKVIPEWMY